MAWPRSDRCDAAVRDAAATVARDGAWPRFVEDAVLHRLAALALDGLARAGVAPPPELVQAAGHDIRAVLALAAEAGRLLALLTGAGVAAAVVKGPPLGALLYGQAGLRQSRDLDLLVAPADAARALDLLEGDGYARQHSPPPQASGSRLDLWRELQKDVLLQHPATGAIVELHHRLTLNPCLLPPLTPADATRIVTAAGVALPTLREADLFPYLCAHGAVSGWYRLKWLADVHAMLAGRSPEEIEALYEAARVRGVGRAAGQALVLCRHVWDLALPGPLAASLDADRRVRWLKAVALKALDAPAGGAFGLTGTAIQLSQFLINDSWTFRWAQLRRAWIDWPLVWAVDLPRPLWWLYALAKPFTWIWRKAFAGR